MSSTLWCQMTTFLICLWLISTLFWVLMFYFASTWPTKALFAFLIACVIFSALFGVLMATDKGEDDTLERMGCTLEELKSHISPQLSDEMDWSNFGDTWHIVQKTPIFEENLNASPDERLKDVCVLLHYTNTMPMRTENLPTNRGSIRTSFKQSPRVSNDGKLEEKIDNDVTIHQ